MTEARRPKKSESLEIRLSHADKQAFMARCNAKGRSASETLRGFIDAELAPPPARPRRHVRHATLAALAAAALGAMAAPSLARPAPAGRFDALDLDHDGRVTVAEFLRLDTDHDGRVSRAEFMAARAGNGRP